MILGPIIDLSHPLRTGMPVYPGDPEVVVSPAATVADDGYNVSHVTMGSQSGTHVDAPFHFLDDGARIDAMALAMFLAPAVVADVRHVGARQPIRWEDLAPIAGKLTAGRIVLLHTGWSASWGTDAYFDHPYLDGGAAAALVAAGIRTIGIDAASIDETVATAQHPSGFAATTRCSVPAARWWRTSPTSRRSTSPTRSSASCRCAWRMRTARRSVRWRSAAPPPPDPVTTVWASSCPAARSRREWQRPSAGSRVATSHRLASRWSGAHSGAGTSRPLWVACSVRTARSAADPRRNHRTLTTG